MSSSDSSFSSSFFGSTGTGASSRGSGDSGASRANVGEQVLDVLALQRLSKKLSPDRLDRHTSGGGELNDLVALLLLVTVQVISWAALTGGQQHTYGNLKTLVGEDQSSVSSSEITVLC